MAGIDIPVEELALIIHPPTLRDIAYMGEEKFFSAMQYLCLNKEAFIQDETISSNLNNFQVLMKVLELSQGKEKKRDVIMLLKLLFPDYTTAITPRSISLMSDGREPIMIDENNFDVLQEAIKQVLCVNSIFQGNNVVYKPANSKAKEIADKLMRGRRKVAELKHGNKSESILTRYISILTVGLHCLTIDDCLNLNLFQLFDLIGRYNAFVEWDVDLRARLTGGKPNEQIESWMRDMHPQT